MDDVDDLPDLGLPPAADAPLTSLSAAQLALGVLARQLSDVARGLVPTSASRSGYGGALIEDARHVAALAREVLAAAVVVERCDSTTWEQVAGALGMTRQSAHQRWAPVVARWEADLEHAAIPGTATAGEGWTSDPDVVAAELDAWVLRHHEPTDPPVGSAPVSSALRRMDPLRELMHLQGVRAALHDRHPDGPPAQALAELVAREAELEQALAADASDEADRRSHGEAAARARAYAAALRSQDHTL